MKRYALIIALLLTTHPFAHADDNCADENLANANWLKGCRNYIKAEELSSSGMVQFKADPCRCGIEVAAIIKLAHGTKCEIPIDNVSGMFANEKFKAQCAERK